MTSDFPTADAHSSPMSQRLLSALFVVTVLFAVAVASPRAVSQDVPHLILPQANPANSAQPRFVRPNSPFNRNRLLDRKPHTQTTSDPKPSNPGGSAPSVEAKRIEVGDSNWVLMRSAPASVRDQQARTTTFPHSECVNATTLPSEQSSGVSNHSSAGSSNGSRAGCGGCSHWIVSTRHCQQKCPKCAACCKLAYSPSCSVKDATPQNRDAFHQWLRPKVPICIVIHGSYFPAEDVSRDCTDAVAWLRKGSPHVQFVCFTWPSGGIFTVDPANAISSLVPAIDVAILGRRAELNGIRLAHFIQTLPHDCPLSIVAHSHGARVASSALHLLGGGQVRGIILRHPNQHRIRTVFAAAAVDHDWLNPTKRYGRALCASECLLNLKSRYDWALGFYPLRRPFSRTALGRTGFTAGDIRQMGRRTQQLSELDVTQLVGTGHIFPHYYHFPDLSATIAPYVGYTH